MATKKTAVKAAIKPAAEKPFEKQTEPDEIVGPVTLVPTDHFSLSINGTLVQFYPDRPFVADPLMQMVLASHNAPVKKHE